MRRAIRTLVGAAALGLSVATAWSVRAAPLPGVAPSSLETTQRRVRGIITAVDGEQVTIAALHGGRGPLTGRVDPKRTRIVVDGRPARPVDLEVPLSVSADLALDEVWISIRVSTAR
jgi:hypothetical protein